MPKLLALLGLLLPRLVSAQDGRLLSQQVMHSDTLQAERIKYTPRFREVFAQTQTLAITYRSGDPRIQGYVVQPGAAGRYPCVIYCRGGHEAVGQFDLWTVSALAAIAQRGYVVVASQLRGTPGSEGHDEAGGADTLDIINCPPWARCLRPTPAAWALRHQPRGAERVAGIALAAPPARRHHQQRVSRGHRQF